MTGTIDEHDRTTTDDAENLSCHPPPPHRASSADSAAGTRRQPPATVDPTHTRAADHAHPEHPTSKHTVAAFPHGKAGGATDDPTGPAPMLVTIPEAGAILGLSRTTMYELIGAGDIEVIHIGRAARVPVDSLAGFIDRLRSVSHPPVR